MSYFLPPPSSFPEFWRLPMELNCKYVIKKEKEEIVMNSRCFDDGGGKRKGRKVFISSVFPLSSLLFVFCQSKRFRYSCLDSPSKSSFVAGIEWALKSIGKKARCDEMGFVLFSLLKLRRSMKYGNFGICFPIRFQSHSLSLILRCTIHCFHVVYSQLLRSFSFSLSSIDESTSSTRWMLTRVSSLRIVWCDLSRWRNWEWDEKMFMWIDIENK